jgi:hypothetical protein
VFTASLLAFAALAGCDSDSEPAARELREGGEPIGLCTSLPIFWGEVQELGELLTADGPEHWALAELRKRGAVKPLDSLAPKGGALPLSRGSILVMAQPYPLSPEENVALDDWVRAGGRLLLFADPMLTGDSNYGLGDRRRPQDVVLLAPILNRWGLELQFDDSQPFGERIVEISGGTLPVNLPGRFAVAAGATGCETMAEGLLADCRIGRGRMVALADAALFESAAGQDADSRRKMLGLLIERLKE